MEVLSPSTEKLDRGQKFARYQQIESLQEYVLVAQDQARLEKFVRQTDGQWLYSQVTGLKEVVSLTSIGCRLVLSEIYEKIDVNGDEANGDEVKRIFWQSIWARKAGAVCWRRSTDSN